jgi:N-acetylglucosamine kinase-like BadF-type ATPase
LLGAARALCGHQTGIACILGTGSNAALYNGKYIDGSATSLGFWLGDEGSGGYLGKQLITDYLNGDLPDELRSHFERRYPDRYPQIMDKVYRQPFPNRYLASFSKFVFDHLSHPYCYSLAYHAFALFFEKRVQKLDPQRQHSVHFTGSVAFYYANVLRQVATDQGYKLGHIAEEPAAGLVLYHQG